MNPSNQAHTFASENRHVDRSRPRTDECVLDEFDDLVVKASHGDRRAIGAIVIPLGTQLLAEAKSALGPLDREAGKVLQNFLLSLVEGRSPFTPGSVRGLPWMLGVVREIAPQATARDVVPKGALP